jgi:predicted hotdog family 3-hydroxylacyl-ACP dehydratase
MGEQQPAVEALVPHRKPMLLLERVERVGDGELEGVGRVEGSHPLCSDGRAPIVLGLELAAQAAAAFEGLKTGDLTGAGPTVGYLVGIPFLPADRLLSARVRPVGSAGGLRIFDVRLVDLDSGEPVLEATLTTYSPGEAR